MPSHRRLESLIQIQLVWFGVWDWIVDLFQTVTPAVFRSQTQTIVGVRVGDLRPIQVLIQKVILCSIRVSDSNKILELVKQLLFHANEFISQDKNN
jgi:hypothetical protein